jgi:hypothetical protein
VRIVYKNVDEAFPLYIPGFEGKAAGSIDVIKGAKAHLNADYKTKIQGLLYSLDELNQSLMITFRAMYVSYQSNPCQHSASLERQVDQMIREHGRLTSLRIKIRGLISLAEAHPNNHKQLVSVFQSIVDQLGGPSVAVAAVLEIADARSEMKRLAGGPDVC